MYFLLSHTLSDLIKTKKNVTGKKCTQNDFVQNSFFEWTTVLEHFVELIKPSNFKTLQF